MARLQEQPPIIEREKAVNNLGFSSGTSGPSRASSSTMKQQSGAVDENSPESKNDHHRERIMRLVTSKPTHIEAGGDAMRLQRLADELSRISRSITAVSARRLASPVDEALPESLAEDYIGVAVMPSPNAVPSADEIRNILRARRLRERFFRSDLFADPAWDMLLDLLAAQVEGEQVAVSSLCIAAAVPATTALRWIQTLSDEGLIERHDDPTDRRRIHIRLSPHGFEQMCRCLELVDREFGRIC